MNSSLSPGQEGLHWRTAGESHGGCLIALLEGLPVGLAISEDAIRAELLRRWQGYGRGLRKGFEKDELQILTGLKKGITLGSPLALQLGNGDQRIDSLPNLKAPRPGHADLPAALRWKTRDLRAPLERASARETAARTALGAIAKQLLAVFEIQVQSQVLSIGGVAFAEETSWKAEVDRAREKGDSLGGRFRLVATGVPPGLGGFAQAADRLDSRLMGLIGSIPAVKAVAIGSGSLAGDLPGSQFHDPICLENGSWAGLGRESNHSGGIEGGLSNGQEIVVEAVMKPIPTLRQGVPSVNLAEMTAERATYERSDVCVVEPAAVVGEALLALQLASVLCARLGAVSLAEMRARFGQLGQEESPKDWPEDIAGLD